MRPSAPEEWLHSMKAIVMLAHIQLINDDMVGATKLINYYTPELKNIDEALKVEEEESGRRLSRLVSGRGSGRFPWYCPIVAVDGVLAARTGSTRTASAGEAGRV